MILQAKLQTIYTIQLVLLVLVLWCKNTNSSNFTRQWRLPSIFKPVKYRLHINITEGALTGASNEYNGMVVIYFNVTNSTNILQLHVSQRYINLNLVTIFGRDLNETSYSIDKVTDIMTVNMSYYVGPEETTEVIIDFTGQLETLYKEGIYRTSYKTEDGHEKYFVATQFKATDARSAFPCFDEPRFKGVFEMYVTYPLGYNAMSNTPGTIFHNDSVSETLSFANTPVMSTYLIAFLISEFTCSQANSTTGVPIQVCSTPNKEASRTFALQITGPLLENLNEYTQVPYNKSMAKLDQVSVPNFEAQAMENWGLILYRPKNLLYDQCLGDKLEIAIIISRELAYSWFGNLVTCDWWSELLVNNGLSTYFAYFNNHDVFPSWSFDKHFVVRCIQSALGIDAEEETIPLGLQVNTPFQINSKFRPLAYQKGASLVGMVKHMIGAENFQTGLRNYLNKYKYKTATVKNMWKELDQTVSGTNRSLRFPLVDIMDNWVEKSGFPLLTVTVQGWQVTVKQDKFSEFNNGTNTTWYIPITYTTSADENKFVNTKPQHWMTPKNSTISFTINQQNFQWIVLNNQHMGYFRINYDPWSWYHIKVALRRPNFGDITEINRAQIVDDLFQLAFINKVTYKDVFETIEFLRYDKSYFVWYPAVKAMNKLLLRFGTDYGLGKTMAIQFAKLIEGLYSQTSLTYFTEDNQLYTVTQSMVIHAACTFGHPNCILFSQRYFEIYKFRGIRPHKNVWDAVYCTAIKYGNKNDWNFLWDIYTNKTTPEPEREAIINGLSCTSNRGLLHRYLSLTLKKSCGVNFHDRFNVFKTITTHCTRGVDVAIEFLEQNSGKISRIYGVDMFTIMKKLATQVTTDRQYDKLQRFFKSSGKSPRVSRKTRIILEEAKVQVNSHKRQERALQSCFESKDSKTPTQDKNKNDNDNKSTKRKASNKSKLKISCIEIVIAGFLLLIFNQFFIVY